MIDSLYIAATGMNAQQTNVDAISNNLANVNTVGFKKSRVKFEDLVYREVARSRGLLGADVDSLHSGSGVAVAGTGKVFTSGEFKKTDQPYDLAIRGQGFFEVLLTDGSRAYTRTGAFQVNKEGMLTTSQGYTLNPAIQVPNDAISVAVAEDGTVTAQVPNEAEPVEIGHIELATFVNAEGLKPLGDNLYLPTDVSGDANLAKPGEPGVGVLAQGFLESSNVKLTEEFVNLIVAQRAYEVNSKAIQASDEMLSIANNLRR